MSSDVISKIDWKDIRFRLAFHCAPVFSGIKVSNLIMVRTDDLAEISAILEETAFERKILAISEDTASVLIFERAALTAYLGRRAHRQFLRKNGYSCAWKEDEEIDLDDILCQLSVRYMRCRILEEDFPHEIGIFLGYPLGDVGGFLHHGGKNYIFSGYWKVYTNPNRTRELFRKFDMVTEEMVCSLAGGTPFTAALEGIGIA